MATVGVVSEILSTVIGVRIVGNPLPNTKLKVPFPEIEIIMQVKAEVIAQSTGSHILVNKGDPLIGVAVSLLPGLCTKRLSVEPQDKPGRVFADQVGNIRIVEEDRSIEGIQIEVSHGGAIFLCGKWQKP